MLKVCFVCLINLKITNQSNFFLFVFFVFIRINQVGAQAIPINMIFRSQSSALNVKQQHQSAAGSQQESKSEDEPHILRHTVKKPIYQMINEIITPYRKITQEVKPVQEDIQTIIARMSGGSNMGGGYSSGSSGKSAGSGMSGGAAAAAGGDAGYSMSSGSGSSMGGDGGYSSMTMNSNGGGY